MSFSNGPTIVTNGLVLALDAGDRNSYVSGSTTWIDLAGTNNGTLLNGPTFNSGSGGSIVFDGVNDYATFPTGFLSTLTACTVNFWVYWSDNQQWTRVIDFGTGITVNMFFTPRTSDTNTPRFAITTGGNISEQRITSNNAMLVNTWYNFSITLNGSTGTMYRNSVIDATNLSTTLTPSSLGNTNQNYLGRSQYSDPYFQGQVSNMQIYNRALTASEVLQNYNATKGRFGL